MCRVVLASCKLWDRFICVVSFRDDKWLVDFETIFSHKIKFDDALTLFFLKVFIDFKNFSWLTNRLKLPSSFITKFKLETNLTKLVVKIVWQMAAMVNNFLIVGEYLSGCNTWFVRDTLTLAFNRFAFSTLFRWVVYVDLFRPSFITKYKIESFRYLNLQQQS